jgi:integrase
LTDPVKPWVKSLSGSTVKAYPATLKRFCDFYGRTAEELLNETRRALRKFERPPVKDGLKLWKDELIRSKLDGSVRTYRKAIFSFLNYNGARIGKDYGSGLRRGPSHRFDPLKQEEVKTMVEKAREPRYKAVIGFFAQTGQRTRVLRGITWEMIKGKRYGIASIPKRLQDKKGVAVRVGDPYKFVIGRDAMDLLNQWPETKKRRARGTFVFGLSDRQIHRIVAEAARDAGVQDWFKRRMPHRVLYKVHPDAFPTYWKDRVREGRMDPVQSNYMMGHDTSSAARDTGLLQIDRLLLAYRQAEPMLDVL